MSRALTALLSLLVLSQSCTGLKSLLLKQNPFSGAVHVDLIPYHLLYKDADTDYLTYIRVPNGDILEVALEHASSWNRKLLGSFSSQVQGFPDASRRQIAQTIMWYYRVDSERWKRDAHASHSSSSSDGSSDSGGKSTAPLGGRMLADYELLQLGLLRAALVHDVSRHEHAHAFEACQIAAPSASLVITVVNTDMLDQVQESLRTAALGADNAKDRLAHKILPYWLTMAPTTRQVKVPSLYAGTPLNNSVHAYEIWPGFKSRSAWSEMSACVVDYTGQIVSTALAHNQPQFFQNVTGHHIKAETAAYTLDTIRVRGYYRVDKSSPFWLTQGQDSRGYMIQRSSMAMIPINPKGSESLQNMQRMSAWTRFDAKTGEQVARHGISSVASSDMFVSHALQTSGFRHRSGVVTTPDAGISQSDNATVATKMVGSDFLRHAVSHYIYEHDSDTVTVIWAYAPGVFQIDAREAVIGIVLALLIISRLIGSDFYRRRINPRDTSRLHQSRVNKTIYGGKTDSTVTDEFTSNSPLVLFRYQLGRSVPGVSYASSERAWHRLYVVDIVQYVLDFVTFFVALGIVIWKGVTIGLIVSDVSRPVAIFYYIEGLIAVLFGLIARPAYVLNRLYKEQRLDETYGRAHLLWCWLLQAFVFEGLVCKSKRIQLQLTHNRVNPGHAPLYITVLGDYSFIIIATTAFCALFGWDRTRLFNFGIVTFAVFLSLAYLLYGAVQFLLICIVGAFRPVRGHATPVYLLLGSVAFVALVAAKIAVFHETHFVTWAFGYTSGLYDDSAIRLLLAATWVFLATYSVDRSLGILDDSAVSQS